MLFQVMSVNLHTKFENLIQRLWCSEIRWVEIVISTFEIDNYIENFEIPSRDSRQIQSELLPWYIRTCSFK